MSEKLEKGTHLILKNDLILKKELAKQVYANYSSVLLFKSAFVDYDSMFKKAYKALENWTEKEWEITKVSELNETIGKIYTISPVNFSNEFFVFSLDKEALLYYFAIKREWTGWTLLYDKKRYVAYYKTNERITFVKIIDKVTGKKYKGKSSCHKEDTFDLNIGKQYALRRAQDKFLKDSAVNENLIITKTKKNYLEIPLNYNLLFMYDTFFDVQELTTQNIIEDFELTETIKSENNWLVGIREYNRYLLENHNVQVQKDNFGIEDICVVKNVVAVFTDNMFEFCHSKRAVEKLVSLLREQEIHRLAIPSSYINNTNFLSLIKEVCNSYKDFYLIIMLCESKNYKIRKV